LQPPLPSPTCSYNDGEGEVTLAYTRISTYISYIYICICIHICIHIYSYM